MFMMLSALVHGGGGSVAAFCLGRAPKASHIGVHAGMRARRSTPMTTARWILPTLALVAGLASAPPAFAGFNSAYTDINLDQCTVINADDFGASWACPGYKGYPLYIAEGDLRFMISYGFDAQNEPAAGQTPPPFNTLGPKLEWRLSNASGGFKPIATIVRYFTADPETGEDKGQVLVVTQLLEGQTCHIAYIDALANPNANELAREAADKAGKFDCANDDVEIIGKFTAWEQ
jgi:hypothetical protein